MAKWMVYTKKADFRAIAQECGISQVLARLIRNRDIIGVEETRRFLKGTLADLYDPRLLKGCRDPEYQDQGRGFCACDRGL